VSRFIGDIARLNHFIKFISNDKSQVLFFVLIAFIPLNYSITIIMNILYFKANKNKNKIWTIYPAEPQVWACGGVVDWRSFKGN